LLVSTNIAKNKFARMSVPYILLFKIDVVTEDIFGLSSTRETPIYPSNPKAYCISKSLANKYMWPA
jgi:hypothetical protein